jgi:hypothetical protein
MTHQHLDEEALQAIALGTGDDPDPAWRDCPQCADRVADYRQVFMGLSGLEPESAGFDLEAAVMAKLPVPVKAVPIVNQRMYSLPIWVGSLVFFLVAGISMASLRGYFAGVGTWVYAIALVTVPGIALWIAFDIIHDHRKKLRSLGLN